MTDTTDSTPPRALVPAIVLAAIAASVVWVQAHPVEPGFDDLWERAAQQQEDPVAQEFALSHTQGRIWSEGGVMRSATAPHEKAIRECVTAIFPTPAHARLVFALDASGAVRQAWADQPGFIADCVAHKTVGMQVQRPPAAGHLLCHRYEKVSDTASVVSGCGPGAALETCTEIGITRTCRVSHAP